MERSTDEARTWRWHYNPDHWMEVQLFDNGLRYIGTDWSVQSGGGYMGGFQSLGEFVRDGGIRGMPEAIEAEIRDAIGTVEGHAVTVRIGGEPPDEIHLAFDGHSAIRRGTDLVFEGVLPDGRYETSGILIYPGADAAGRRRMRTFRETLVVAGADVDVVIERTEPRFG